MTPAEELAPYKGLRPFDDAESDVPFFFGRERDRELIVANLVASRLTVLYGETGVGKSSVLRAGVAHQLRREARASRREDGAPRLAVALFDDWRGDPIEGVVAAAADSVRDALGDAGIRLPMPGGSLADRLEAWAGILGGDLYIVLDQTEEFFLYHDAEEGAAFVAAFAEAVRRPGLRVSFLMALREDAVAKLDRFKGQVPNVLGNYLRLDYLDRAAGREAIVGPVARYGELVSPDKRVEIEPDLVEAVLDQVAAGKVELAPAGRGVLESRNGAARVETPFLQLVMQRLWETERERGSRLLRLETLRELGGAERIVRDHLEHALATLTPKEKDVAASVFNHLVTPSGTKIAHATPDLARYADVGEPELEPVLSALARERIVRPVAADDGGGRHEIYHDVLGEAVLAWRLEHEAGRELERERQAAERRHRRLLQVIGLGVVLLVLMAGVTTFALLQRSDARAQARKAHARELDAAAVSLLPSDPGLSLALAIKAAELATSAEAEQVLRSSVLASRERLVLTANGPMTVASFSRSGALLIASRDGLARVYDGRLALTLDHHAPILDAAFGTDSSIVVTAGEDGTARIWRGGKAVRTLRHGGPVRSTSFSRDGTLLVTAGGRAAKIWRADGRLVAAIAWKKPVTGASLSPDARRVVVTGNDRLARLYETAQGRLLRSFDQAGIVTSASFSPERGLLATTGANDTARIWRIRDGRLLHELRGHKSSVADAAFSPGASRLVTASFDGTGRIWNVGSGRLVATLVELRNPVVTAAFSPDGQFVVTGNTKGAALVSNAETGDARVLLAGHHDFVRTAEFSPDGRRVVTASDDHTARVWDPETQPPLAVVHRANGPLAEAEYVPGNNLLLVAGPGRSARLVRSSDGRTVRVFRTREPAKAIAASQDGELVAVASGRRAVVFRVADGASVADLAGPDAVYAVAFSSDGSTVVTGGRSGIGRIWSIQDGLLRELNGHTKPITDVAFSPDGNRVATASEDATARVWTVENGKLEHELAGHRDSVTSITFSPDGRLVLTASADHDARLWSADTGAPVEVLRWHFGLVSDANFSPDGRWIVTAGPASAQLWQPGLREPILPYGFGGHKRPLTSAVFDPTGRYVLTASGDGTVRRGECSVCGDLKDLLARSRAQLSRSGRRLSADERARYGFD